LFRQRKSIYRLGGKDLLAQQKRLLPLVAYFLSLTQKTTQIEHQAFRIFNHAKEAKPFMTILFFLLLFFGSSPHDIQVAYYKISQDDLVHVDFVFEAEDLRQTLKNSADGFSQKGAEEYLEQHFAISLNGKVQKLSYGDMDVKHRHVYINATIKNLSEPITTLEISNTCLLNIQDHSNVIEINLHQQERDFLMNKNRTEIVVNY